jgi:hypothetical protein
MTETDIIEPHLGHIRNSQSGCGSRLHLAKKNMSLRTKYVNGKNHETRIHNETQRQKSF